jgi:hypothetical protein
MSEMQSVGGADIEKAPEAVDTLRNRGNLLAMLDRNEKAPANHDRALRSAPNAPDILDRRGNLLEAAYATMHRQHPRSIAAREHDAP